MTKYISDHWIERNAEPFAGVCFKENLILKLQEKQLSSNNDSLLAIGFISEENACVDPM